MNAFQCKTMDFSLWWESFKQTFVQQAKDPEMQKTVAKAVLVGAGTAAGAAVAGATTKELVLCGKRYLFPPEDKEDVDMVGQLIDGKCPNARKIHDLITRRPELFPAIQEQYYKCYPKKDF